MVLMRFFELLLTLVLVSLPLQFILPPKVRNLNKEFILGGTSIIGFLIGLFHIILEGIRWQMFPIYIPAFIIFSLGVFSLIQLYIFPQSEIMSREEPTTRFNIKSILSLTGFVIVLVLVISSIFINILLPPFNLPPTTGEFKVGTTTFSLTDPSRDEIFTENQNDVRNILIRAWYPAKVTGNPNPVPYVESPSQFENGIQRSFGFPGFVVSHFTLVLTHSYRDVPLSDEKTAFPVLLYSHGYGGLDFQNTVLMEELASHGFVIFSLNHVYESTVAVFPDGTTIYETEHEDNYQINNSLEIWTQDTLFLIDQLEMTNNDNIPPIFWNKLDLDRIGAVGHSFGGTTAEEVVLVDTRVKVGISLDSPHIGNSLEMNLTKPFMLMFGEDYGNPAMNDTVFLRSENACYGLYIDGAKHYNFADASIWAPFLKVIGYLGSIEGYRVLNIINRYVLAFFDEYLNGIPSSFLDGPSTDYPEVHFYSKNT